MLTTAASLKDESRRTDGAGAVARRQARRRRAALLQQLLLLGALAAVGAVIVRNTVVNLQARGLASGFDFLWQEAGFNVGFTLIAADATSTYGRIFLVGLLNSLLVAAVAMVAATMLGFLIGLARVSQNIPARLLSKGYVELVRNLPLLLHLLLWQGVILRSLPTVKQAHELGGVAFLSNRGLYLAAPVGWSTASLVFLGGAGATLCIGLLLARRAHRRQELLPPAHAVGMILLAAAFIVITVASVDWDVPVLGSFDYRGGVKIMPELAALVAALTLYNAAFVAEIVRAGIQSVSPGQRQAATALGLSARLTMRLIIVPQAVRVMVPPMANQYAHLIKASALATVVGFPDLVNVFMGTALNQTGRAVEIVVMTAAVYLTLTASVGLVTGWYDRRMKLVER
ncbi:amino acid ABC transporter permease [Pelagibius marinus]|uniref:amino acid ABC transporter permease n=1 Tax=Pelagibius marinus TaxID=2762760 RepID=UPI001872CAF0|nr:ABC transporter permease subunit [Pelagibius marinus]